MKNKFLILLFIFSIFLAGCDNSTEPGDPPAVVKRGILVVNEGLYSQNNSSLTFFNLDERKLYSNAYKAANNSKNLGDTANDLFIFQNKGYITVDLSNKIEIINLDNFESEGFIDLGANAGPREVIVLNENEGYVTSSGNDAVIKFNPTTKSIISEIKVGSKPDGIDFFQDKIFVANSGYGSDSTVTVIQNNQKIADIDLSINPRFVHKDNNYIYVVCSGDYMDAQGLGAVYKINPINNQVIDTLYVNGNPGESCLTGDGYMYIVNNFGILKIDLTSFSLVTDFLISNSSVNSTSEVIYSVAFDSDQQRIMAGNPKNFMQNGEIVIYDLSGNEVTRFDSGINPGTISIIDQYPTN